MKLYDVGETVEEGLPVSVLEEEQRAYLNVGRDIEDYECTSVVLPFGGELSRHLLSEDNPMNVKEHREVLVMRGTIAREDGMLCIVGFTGADRTALVRVGIAHGEGGKIQYFFGEYVDIIAEGVLKVGEQAFPVYVLVMPMGSSFYIHRTGDIDGLPSEMSFLWDGEKMIRE